MIKLLTAIFASLRLYPCRSKVFMVLVLFLDKKLILSAIKQTKATIVLKGNNTLIANNKKILINKKTSNELAVIGTGDVLAGLISSLVGDKKMKPIEAAAACVWIHSRTAIKLKRGLIAEDLIKNIKKTINYIYGKYS